MAETLEDVAQAAHAGTKIVHLHIPKTAGTALREAFGRVYGTGWRVFPHRYEGGYAGIDPSKYDFFSGHIGFNTASQLGGDIITVFRDPVERFISVYFFWRQLHASGVEVTRNTTLAAHYSIDEFAQIKDEPFLLEEFHNRMTWQIAYGSSLAHRLHLRDQAKTEDEIFRTAIDNLREFAVIGIQERMPEFAEKLYLRYDIRLRIEKSNVTDGKSDRRELSMRTLRTIHEWLYMDIELYQQVLTII